jgi:branched-chain amino acid transport system substrate-binding protein
MNKKILWVILLVVVVVIMVVTTGSKNKDESIKIGALYAVTGPAAQFGEGSIQGVKDAVSYFEEKTNKKVDLIVEDTAGDAKQAVTSATKLFNIDKVRFAVVGMSGPSASVAPLADQYKNLVISDAAGYGLTKGKKYILQNFLPSLNDISLQINSNQSYKKVAVVYINDEFGVKWAEFTRDNVTKDKKVELFSFEKTATDFRTQAAKINQFKPDVIVTVGYGPALNQAYSDMNLLGVKAPFITYLSCTFPGLLTDNRFSLEGQGSYEYPNTGNNDMNIWIKNHGGSSATFYSIAFENTLVLLNAIDKTGGDVDRSIEYLKSNDVDGLYGKVRFNQDGYVERDLVLTKVEGGKCVPIK